MIHYFLLGVLTYCVRDINKRPPHTFVRMIREDKGCGDVGRGTRCDVDLWLGGGGSSQGKAQAEQQSKEGLHGGG